MPRGLLWRGVLILDALLVPVLVVFYFQTGEPMVLFAAGLPLAGTLAFVWREAR